MLRDERGDLGRFQMRQAAHHIQQVRVGIVAGVFAGGDDRQQVGGGAPGLAVADEEPVLAAQCYGADGVLGRVVSMPACGSST